MPEQSPTEAVVELRARFAATPRSVPGARAFVAKTLTSWGRTPLLDDATLCVSELAGNAALHSSSTYMEVVLRAHQGGVRISVEDDGPTLAGPVAARGSLLSYDDADVSQADHPTTGRGLAIVSILARSWGVEKLDIGKRIWVELAES